MSSEAVPNAAAATAAAAAEPNQGINNTGAATTVNTGGEQKGSSPGGKKGRHRKKHKFNAIRQQMEFYFSDANLAKDRYLSQCLKEDPFISLEEFLKFNRIKTLTDNVEDIAVALKNSELLELSEDRTKVHRVTEFQERPNCEDCTIYVESLPPKADHEWVRNVFSAYGKVVYVSLPTFKYSKKIKEFGFVEFEEESSVQKAIKTFQAFGGVLTFEDTDPEQLLSISSYGKEKEEEARKEKEGSTPKEEEGKSAAEEEVKEESVEPPAKRVKKCESDASDGEPAKDSGNEESHSEVEGDKKGTEEGEKKKRRRRRGPSGVKKEIQQDDKVYELKIMSKKEWRRLRNKYLNLQRVEAKKLKKLFSSSGKPAKVQQNRTPNQSCGSKTVKSSPRVNFYGALTDEEAAAEVTKFEEHDQQNKQPLFSFEPGLIVNIRFRVPCANVKDFKAELKQFPYVKYIDLKEGDSQAFVRVDKPGSANQLVKEYSMAEYSAQILSGETEKSYWDKIKCDREDKLNKKVKVERVRGRSKLMKKVGQHNTHIKFDDE